LIVHNHPDSAMSETQLADQFLYQSSLKSDPELKVSSRKHVPFVIDLNQGSYSNGIITIDATSQLNGSEGFASLRDAYLMVPYKVSMKNDGTTALATDSLSRLCVGLKCGVWNVIDSMSLELNGKSLISMSDYKMFWNNVRAQTEFSQQYVEKHGADSFLFPDTPESFAYSVGNGTTTFGSSEGDGYTATGVYGSTGFGQLGPIGVNVHPNEGLRKRILANPPTVAADSMSTWPAFGNAASSISIAQQLARGGFINGDTAVGAIVGTWDYMLKIRLVDLHPIFKEIDLMANPQIRLRFRVNQGSCY
jgi:hypothetical protein